MNLHLLIGEICLIVFAYATKDHSYYEYSGLSRVLRSVTNIDVVNMEAQSTARNRRESNGNHETAVETIEDSDDGIQWLNGSYSNATVKNVTHHKYYDLYYYVNDMVKFNKTWIDVRKLLAHGATGHDAHPHLKNSYRRAVNFDFNFEFPFYGHPTTNATIATGGFLYVGDHIHSWLAATQYIAPLMANFDTTKSNDSGVRYAFTNDTIVVEWHEVFLRGQEEHGNFTFQTILKANGDIYFVYKTIPVHVDLIADIHHPKKAGLSDAYLMNHPFLTMSRRVIYEYHRIDIPANNITNNTVIEIKALDTCIGIKTCEDCMKAKLKNFNCSWCFVSEKQKAPEGPFCSDDEGLNRRRQDWVKHSCDRQAGSAYCNYAPTPDGDYDNEMTPTPAPAPAPGGGGKLQKPGTTRPAPELVASRFTSSPGPIDYFSDPKKNSGGMSAGEVVKQ